jgi:transcriptional regulator with XRE-family HTH domain
MANEKKLIEARKIIASFLKQRRLELGYSQAHIAEQTGLGLRTIVRAEQADFWLGMKQYLLICEALHLFPAIAEMESNTEIAEALRQNWKPNPKDMSIEDALKAKANSNKRPDELN